MTNIAEVMNEVNNYFELETESGTYEFQASTKKIIGTFDNTYLVGQYIRISMSRLNDDVYKIAAVGVGEITVEEDLIDENTSDDITVHALAPTKGFLRLVNSIVNYVSKEGVASETIDNYSISFSIDGSWVGAFSKQLNRYRKAKWC